MPTTNTSVTQKLDRFLGRCDPCTRPVAVERLQVAGDFLNVACPECGRRVRLERLYGTQTTMKCDPRCEGAVGSDCECACGGSNHGGAFLMEGEALASAVAKYRKQAQVRSDAAKKVAEERAAKAKVRARQALSAEEQWVLEYEGASRFLTSLRDQVESNLERSGWSLSDRQIAAIRDNMDKSARLAIDRAEANAPTPAAPRKATVPCPEGEGIEIIGKVVKLSEKEMANGPVLQGRIVTEGGWSCWGTIPRALRECGVNPLLGHQVRFTANLRRQDDSFGFWGYPEGGEVLDA
jgi:hypothetical protein